MKIRTIVAWGFYWCGDRISDVMIAHQHKQYVVTILYLMYNKLMLISDYIQGDHPGPWGRDCSRK